LLILAGRGQTLDRGRQRRPERLAEGRHILVDWSAASQEILGPRTADKSIVGLQMRRSALPAATGSSRRGVRVGVVWSFGFKTVRRSCGFASCGARCGAMRDPCVRATCSFNGVQCVTARPVGFVVVMMVVRDRARNCSSNALWHGPRFGVTPVFFILFVVSSYWKRAVSTRPAATKHAEVKPRQADDSQDRARRDRQANRLLSRCADP